MRSLILIAVLGSLLPISLLAVEPIRDHIESTTTISQSYDARSTFSNPAALGYQTQRDGAQLLSSFSVGLNQNQTDDFSFALGYGALGFGVEKLLTPTGALTRYGFSLGSTLSPTLFFGTRFTFTRSDIASLSRINSLDMGLQYRPSKYYSFGFLAESLNQPLVSGVRLPIRLVSGITVRPFPRLEFTADVDTNADAQFGKTLGYDLNTSVELFRGLRIRGGYHKDKKWQVGFQFNFGFSSYYSVFHPDNRAVRFGAQAAFKPYPSTLSFSDTLEITLRGDLGEEPVYGGLFGKHRPSVLNVLRKLHDAKNDSRIGRVMIRILSFPLGLAASEDLHSALWAVRQSGKHVDVYLGNAGMKEYFIASAAHRIFMEPAAELRLNGLRSSRYYLKGTLDKIGIEGELFAKGKYKSAPEMFNRKSSSPASRETTLARLKVLESVLVEQMTKTKRIDKKSWQATLNHALFSATEAKAKGLIDHIGSWQIEKEKYFTRKSLATQSDRLALRPRVAVIVASGDIVQGGNPVLSLGGRSQITFKKMEDRFTKALSDPLTKAIVFRISSGGGEILPSQQIATLVENAQRQIPIVVSMGDAAASGGYMIAAPASIIFAAPTTLTGSIGVFLGKVNLTKLYRKIDLHKEVLSYAPFADLYSEHKPLNEKGRLLLTRRLNDYYDLFVTQVTTHRKLTKSAGERVAQGRVWTGKEAKKHQLVDHNGTYLEAIAYAGKMVGLGENDFDFPIIRGNYALLDPFGEAGWIKAKAALPLPPFSQELLAQLQWGVRFQKQPYAYLSDIGKIE